MANYGGDPGSPYNLPPPPQRPSAPASVLTAVKLMYAGAALSLISLVIGLTQKAAIRKAVAAANPNFTDSQLNSAVNITLVFGAFVGLLGAGLWLWMAYANNKGHAWARVVSSVLFGINTLGLIYVLIAAGSTAIQKVASVVIWLVGLAAVVFLWRSDSSAYFNAP
jgi:low temperature requirement protein LtrA